MLTSTREEQLEEVVARLRFYIEKHTEFLVREAAEGRDKYHYVSPRVAHAYRDLMVALDQLDEGGG